MHRVTCVTVHRNRCHVHIYTHAHTYVYHRKRGLEREVGATEGSRPYPPQVKREPDPFDRGSFLALHEANKCRATLRNYSFADEFCNFAPFNEISRGWCRVDATRDGRFSVCRVLNKGRNESFTLWYFQVGRSSLNVHLIQACISYTSVICSYLKINWIVHQRVIIYNVS